MKVNVISLNQPRHSGQEILKELLGAQGIWQRLLALRHAILVSP
jgi:hypothetical protein